MVDKHTPGPWTVAGIPDRYGFQSIVIDGPKAIAYAFCIQHDPATGDPLNRGLDEQQANAKLIAAAPDLLDLLKKARDSLGPENSLWSELDISIDKATTGEQ